MNEFQITLLVSLIMLCSTYWIIPYKHRMLYTCFFTFVFLSFTSAFTAAILSLQSVITFGACKYLKKSYKKINLVLVYAYLLVFLLYQYYHLKYAPHFMPMVLGGAYFTCRQIHFLLEHDKGRIQNLSFSSFFSYQFFLPTLFAGPINRYPNFITQFQRASYDANFLSISIEKIIYAYFKLVIIASYLINIKLSNMVELLGNSVLHIYGVSIVNWLYIYVAFSALTDIALGFSGVLGLKLEENFNQPYKACSLIDFWQRWHMTLTNWIKDYIFFPVFAKFRSQSFAVIISLIAVGLWHQTSLYYLLWGCYQALGIILCKMYQSSSDILKLNKLPSIISLSIKKLLTFGWLVSAMPLLSLLGLSI